MNKKLFGTLLLGSLLMGGTFVSCQDYDDDIKDLQAQIDGLKGLQSSLDQVKSDLSAAQSSTQANITSAVNALKDGDVKKALAEAADAAAKAGDAQKAAEAATALAEAAQKAAEGNTLSEEDAKQIAWVKENAEKLATVAALTKCAEDLKKELEEKINGKADAKTVEELAKKIEALQGSAAELVGKRLTSLVFAPTTYINGIESIEFASMQYNDWGNKPENWLRDAEDGLVYTSQYVKAEVDKATYEKNKAAYVVDGGKYYVKTVATVIGDNSATAEYYVSPSAGVTLDGIKNLDFLFNAAVNTRAEAPIKIDSKSLKDGKLTLKLVKNVNAVLGQASFEDNNKAGAEPKFTIAALQATLADAVLTDAEKEAKAEVNVTSDWARLYETVNRPYIANSLIRDVKGNLVCTVDSKTKDSHFWAYTEVYNGAALSADEIKKGVQLYDRVEKDKEDIEDNFIAKSHKYSEPLDLLEVVTVCDKSGKEWKNYESYGLKYEFHIMKYLVENKAAGGITVDNTDQAKFAILDGTTLIATARDNTTTFNADAVGRTPVIQAVLKDVKNDKVVDVRYLKIKWVANDAVTTIWTPASLTPAAWSCTANYEAYIYEEYMNNLYAKIIDGGMTRDQFHGTYSKVYETAANASFFAYTYTEGTWPNQKTYTFSDEEVLKMLSTKDERLAKMVIGKVEDIKDGSLGAQTHNFKVTANYGDYRVNGSVKNVEQDYDVKGFFAFVSADNMNQVVVPVTIPVKAGTLKYKYNYLASQWEGALELTNADKTRPVNPTLYSDATVGTAGGYATTQLIGDITYGYMADGKTPADYTKLLGYYNFKDTKFKTDLGTATSDVVFDGDRLSMLPSLDFMTVKNAAGQVTAEFGWALAEANKTLYLAEKYLTGDNKGKVKPATDASAIIAAKINDALGESNKYIYLVDEKTVQNSVPATVGTATADPTTAALLLVGKAVPVKVLASQCDTKVFDKYLVRFITPLEWAPASDNVVLHDVKNDGEVKAVAVANQLSLKEAFGSRQTLRLVADDAINWANSDADYNEYKAKMQAGGYSVPDRATYNSTIVGTVKVPATPATTVLNKWYEVSSVSLGANILINIDKSGNVLAPSASAAGYSKISEITKADGTTQLYTIELLQADKTTPATTAAALKYVKYHNNSGQAITKDLVIKIPVALDTKWQKGIANYITVTVKPNI